MQKKLNENKFKKMSIRSKDETDLTYFTKSKEYNRIGTFFCLHKKFQ